MSTFYWSAKTFAVAPATRLLFRPWVKGLGNVPAEGAAILASNHLSVSDSVFMPAMLKRQVHFLAKKDYFTGAGPKGWITRKFFEATNQLPMDRSGGEASLRSLDAGLEALREGRP
ncbi:1-acyl-sn-glycerol-3-phosphate acyltransferase, partial [Micrococcus endophyticus]